jgi:transposase InsO family protein
MSALTVPTFAAAPDPADWLPALDAAERLAKHPGHFTRCCRDELARRGLAVKAADPSRPGPDRWYVNRAYDPRLSIDAPLHIGPGEADLEGFTDRQRSLALQRRACVERFREARRTRREPLKQWLPALLAELAAAFPDVRISRSGLYGWHEAYAGPGDTLKLVDARGGDRRSTSSDAAWQFFRGLFLHQNQPTVAQCWEMTRDEAAAKGWGWCSLARCRAQLDRRIDPQQQARHRTPALYRTRLAPYIEQDPEKWAAGETWLSDDKQLDLVCRFEGRHVRPWLTTWMDWRTRRVTGWVLSDNPNSGTILAALRQGLLDERNFGGPDTIWTDNGKAFDARMFQGRTKRERQQARGKPAGVDRPTAFGIFHALKIDPHFGLPYNPNSKGRLERWFRTLERFAKTFDTYTGDGADTRPERLGDVLKQGRAVPTFQQVYDRLGPFIAGYNAADEHARRDMRDESTGELLSPDEAMARWCKRRRVYDRKALDLLLMHWHRPVTVGRNGVTIAIQGRAVRYGQFEPALSPFKGLSKADRRPVLVSFDPHGLSSVRVYDEQFRFVCVAPMNQLGGMRGAGKIGQKHVAELNRQKASYDKALRVIAGTRITQVLTTEEQLAVIAAEQHDAARAAAAAEQAPAPLKLVATPLDTAARKPAPSERPMLLDDDGGGGGGGPKRPSALERWRERMGRATPDPAADVDDIPDPFERLRRLHA